MKTVHTFSVVFWLKKRSTRKDGTIPIYARITVDGIRADVSTKHAVLRTHWCSDTGRVRTKVSGARSMNDDLAKVYQDITQSKKELLEEGMLLTAQSIKLRYLGQDVPLRTLKDLLQYHKDNEVAKLEQGTAKNYGATEKYLLSFIKKKYRSSNVQLAHINYSFVLSFENFLRNCKPLRASQPLTNNGIMKHMERLKKMTTKTILSKYAHQLYGKNEDLLLPVYSNQKCNKYLKILASKCGIEKNLSFHCARHTFATSVTLANGVPIETVSKLLGHKKLSTTQIYARVLEKKISEDISDLRSKLKSSERKVA